MLSDLAQLDERLYVDRLQVSEELTGDRVEEFAIALPDHLLCVLAAPDTRPRTALLGFGPVCVCVSVGVGGQIKHVRSHLKPYTLPLGGNEVVCDFRRYGDKDPIREHKGGRPERPSPRRWGNEGRTLNVVVETESSGVVLKHE
jgi:hypothetical protein